MYDFKVNRLIGEQVNKEKFNLKNKLYQMFILGLEGTELKDNPNLAKALNEGLGGVIFFTQNIKTTDQFKKLIKDIKSKALIPPFLSIDQEGGRVERTENLYGGKKYLNSAKCCCDLTLIKEQTEKIALELKDFGINLNFAPVLDVNTNPNNPIIGERAFSNNADDVIKCGKIVVETYIKNGIIPCTKHFPGHGDASVDSHISLPKINLSLDKIEKTHIKPFKEVESPMVMVAHLYCTAFDKKEIPSSLSKNVLNYLKETLCYKGLIITDDMVMGGVQMQRCKDEKIQSELAMTAYRAIIAGVNILLYRNSFDETIQIIENLAQLALKDKELLKNIDSSFEKIIAFKNENLDKFFT